MFSQTLRAHAPATIDRLAPISTGWDWFLIYTEIRLTADQMFENLHDELPLK